MGVLSLSAAMVAVAGMYLGWRRMRPPASAGGDPELRVISLDQIPEGPSVAAAGDDRLGAVPAVRPSRDDVPEPTAARRQLAERLYAIDWFQFEKLMAVAFRRKGYRVERRGGAHADDGIDLVLERNGERTAVQCKHWKAWKVNPKTVRELLGAMTGAGIRRGMLLTLRGFTQDAELKAREYGITLWSEHEILDLLRTEDAEFDPDLRALLDDKRKYCPRCESEMVIRMAKRGPEVGNRFWGCSRYPICLHTLPLSEAEAEATSEAVAG